MKSVLKAVLLSGMLIGLVPEIVLGAGIEKKGSTSYVTHFVFHPLSSVDIPNVGKATAIEAVAPVTDGMLGALALAEFVVNHGLDARATAARRGRLGCLAIPSGHAWLCTPLLLPK